jgi:hypothetical protein
VDQTRTGARQIIVLELPLAGGNIHDWNCLLGQAGLLDRAEVLG